MGLARIVIRIMSLVCPPSIRPGTQAERRVLLQR